MKRSRVLALSASIPSSQRMRDNDPDPLSPAADRRGSMERVHENCAARHAVPDCATRKIAGRRFEASFFCPDAKA